MADKRTYFIVLEITDFSSTERHHKVLTRTLFHRIMIRLRYSVDIISFFQPKGGMMHDAIGLPTISNGLDEECDIIDRISELFPKTSSIKNFRSAGGISTAGYMRFQWKYHQDRVLYVRWDGLFLDIKQKLSSEKSEKGVTFPVTWGSDVNSIPFDGNGQARLPRQASHDFWCELAGIVAEKI